jgi:hypothetical protein
MENITEFNLCKRNSLYGIVYQECDVVPFVYDDPEDAIDELIWFETENFNRPSHQKFLPYTKNIEEISKLKRHLIEQIIIK